jgi:hypothetical protein
LVSATVAV